MNNVFAAGRPKSQRGVLSKRSKPLYQLFCGLSMALSYAQLTGAGVNAFSVVKPTEL